MWGKGRLWRRALKGVRGTRPTWKVVREQRSLWGQLLRLAGQINHYGHRCFVRDGDTEVWNDWRSRGPEATTQKNLII